MNFKLLMGCVLTAALVQTAAAGAARVRVDPVAYERSLKGKPFSGTPAPSIRGSVSYMNTTVGGPTYTRAFEDCSGLSGLGVGVSYHSQEFSVDTTGAYNVNSMQTGFDGMIFIYQNSFNPASATTNCVFGDDDGAGGIGTSDITGAALTAGTTYFLVTTGFEPVDSGPFTNTFNGAGNVTIGPAGPQADLGIVKTAPDGVVTGGNFSYQLTASNAGPIAATGVVVTDVLPAGVNFVSSTCGATNAAGTVTWNIGALANGGSASCTLTVTLASAMCVAVSNTATIDGAEGDGNGANNSSTISNSSGNIVTDPSFEGGSPSAAWAETSTNFGTPLCTVAACGGTGTGTGPRTGSWWAWFGGSTLPEVGSLEQSVTIPAGAANITFWVEAPVCGNATDFVRLLIDGTEVWRLDGTSPSCNVVGYTQVTVPLTAGQANGAAHLVRFDSTTSGTPGLSNFFIDDIAIVGPPTCAAPANADLSITLTSAPVGAVTLGSNVTFTATVSNAGPGAASGVVATIVIPQNIQIASNTCGATAVGSTVTWTIGALANGANATCSITGQVIRTGQGFATASVTATAPADPVLANNTASAGIAVAFQLPASGNLSLLVLLLGVAGAGWVLMRRTAG